MHKIGVDNSRLLGKEDIIRKLSQKVCLKLVLLADGFDSIKKGSHIFVITPSDDYIRIEKLKYYRYLSVLIDRALQGLRTDLKERGIKINTDEDKISVSRMHERFYFPPLEYYFNKYVDSEFLNSTDLARLDVFIDICRGTSAGGIYG